MILRVLGKVAPSEFKNNLRIILGSKSQTFKNIEALKKLVILIKKSVLCRDHTTQTNLGTPQVSLIWYEPRLCPHRGCLRYSKDRNVG